MKFKAGDRVKIVSLQMTGLCFGLNSSKEKLLGKTVTVQDISSICSCIINDWIFHIYDLQLFTSELEVE